ncbi:MAG: RNA polymerase sigma factor [Myxococcota bacterium]|nr:RNA polymerase sigma factor [Myxococcota bacterium]
MPEMQSVAEECAATQNGAGSWASAESESVPKARKTIRARQGKATSVEPPVPGEPLSDADLVRGILAADDACFNVLYERYFNRVYAYSYRRLRNHSDAEEITQETFMTVFRSIANFRGQSTLLSWIFGVARNLSNNSLRRFQGQREKFDSVCPEHFAPNSSIGNAAPDDELNMRRYVDAIRNEMEELPTWQRRIFEMRHLENMSISEISSQTQRSSDAVRSSLYRMKRMIFEAIDLGAEASLR